MSAVTTQFNVCPLHTAQASGHGQPSFPSSLLPFHWVNSFLFVCFPADSSSSQFHDIIPG